MSVPTSFRTRGCDGRSEGTRIAPILGGVAHKGQATILVEPTPARQQLPAARGAPLQIAPRMVMTAALDAAITAPRATAHPARLAPERNQPDVTPAHVQGIDCARRSGGHLAPTPLTHHHLATSARATLISRTWRMEAPPHRRRRGRHKWPDTEASLREGPQPEAPIEAEAPLSAPYRPLAHRVTPLRDAQAMRTTPIPPRPDPPPQRSATLTHMADVGIRALKQNASAVVADAAAGETITITDRGRPVARLTPLPATRLQALLDSGRARPARRRIDDLTPPKTGPSLTAELAAMRADERS